MFEAYGFDNRQYFTLGKYVDIQRGRVDDFIDKLTIN
jgi:hypothetical protein